MARPKVRWEHTWPYLLERLLCARGNEADVINCGIRSRTIDSLVGVDFHEHIVFKSPDILVLQIGVVDCAPRIFSRRENNFINLPIIPYPLRKLIIQWRSARRAKITARKPLRKVYTKPKAFSNYILAFQAKLAQNGWKGRVIVLPVLSNKEAMELKSPGHFGNATLYNQLWREGCQATGWEFLSPEQLNIDRPEYFLDDGYHLSEEGNAAVAAVLCEAICSQPREPVLPPTPDPGAQTRP